MENILSIINRVFWDFSNPQLIWYGYSTVIHWNLNFPMLLLEVFFLFMHFSNDMLLKFVIIIVIVGLKIA